MASAVLRDGKHTPFIIAFCGLIIFAIFSYPLAAHTIKTESSQKDSVTERGIISLHRRLQRNVGSIQFFYVPLPKLAEPFFVPLGKRGIIPEELLQHQGIPLVEKPPASARMVQSTRRGFEDSLVIVGIGGLIQSISLDKDTYKQGEIATLNINTVLPLKEPQIRFLYRTYKLYPITATSYQTILAVPMDVKPGKYKMTLTHEEKGEKKDLKIPFTVIAGDFAEDDTAQLDIHILTEETLEMLKYEGRYFSSAYSKNSDSILHDGEFIWPCSGTITSMFGIARKYNKGLDRWSHKAIDIANSVGTKVVASNHGTVVMAEDLEGHGKSVVIGHGQGIHTVYIHLNKIKVKKGDRVTKGQVIGELGKTGMCTGPNLHFQITVNRIPTDPRYWIKGAAELGKGAYVKPELTEKSGQKPIN